jgi:hypothetical protein
MRHADLWPTMGVCTDPKVFDMARAVEKLPTIAATANALTTVTGTDTFCARV